MFGASAGRAVTFQIHTCIAVPLELFATALTFHIPGRALALVYDDSLMPVSFFTSDPLINQVTLTVWFTVMLNIRELPSVSFTGERGAYPVMFGASAGRAVTFQIHTCI